MFIPILRVVTHALLSFELFGGWVLRSLMLQIVDAMQALSISPLKGHSNVMGGMCFQLLTVNTTHQEQRTNTRHPPGTVIGGSLSPLKGPSKGSVWWPVGSGHCCARLDGFSS